MNWNYYQPTFEYEKDFNDLEWPWAGHKYFAYDFIRNIKPKVIVELGTHKGTSFFSFCQAVKDENLATNLFAVDTWKGDEHTGGYKETVFQEVLSIKDLYYKNQNIHLLKMTFDEALNSFQDDSIDILHIDGFHTYEAVKHDFESWSPKIKDDGLILFHDISERKDDFGVYKLWDELKEKYKTVEFIHSHGLGVLFKDLNVFEKFNSLKIWQYYYPLIGENKLLNLKIQRHEIVLQEKCVLIQEKEKMIQEIKHSWSWRITAPLRFFLKFFRKESFIKEKFTHVYKTNGFQGENSLSGGGSDLVQTEIIRKEIPLLLQEFQVKTFLDAPCGDFYWLRDTDLGDVHYIGVDIVDDLIAENKKKYGNQWREFFSKDIIQDSLPQTDLIFCRDCLVHLTFKQAKRAIANFKKSGARYLLATTFADHSKNEELTTLWRPLNLEKAPFRFPRPLKMINEHCTEDNGIHADKSLGLWKLDDILL